MENLIFYLFAFMAVAGGVLLVALRNPVSSALAMVLSFARAFARAFTFALCLRRHAKSLVPAPNLLCLSQYSHNFGNERFCVRPAYGSSQ